MIDVVSLIAGRDALAAVKNISILSTFQPTFTTPVPHFFTTIEVNLPDRITHFNLISCWKWCF